MFSFSRILLVAALAVSVFAAPEPTRTTRNEVASLNPVGIVTRPVAQKPDVPLTNAQRLARGLPPNRPRARYGRRGQALQPRQSSTAVVRTGYISVMGVPEDPVAYVSKDMNIFGEYQLTTDVSKALSVSVSTESLSAPFEIAALNGADGFDFAGFSTGFGNTGDIRQLEGGTSFNYAYLTGVNHEPRGPAVNDGNTYTTATGLEASVESVVWSFGTDDELLPSWVNPDGNVADVAAFWALSDNTFIITGSGSSFLDVFGSENARAVTFKLVSA